MHWNSACTQSVPGTGFWARLGAWNSLGMALLGRSTVTLTMISEAGHGVTGWELISKVFPCSGIQLEYVIRAGDLILIAA